MPIQVWVPPAIAAACHTAGRPDPTKTPLVADTLRGIARQPGAAPRQAPRPHLRPGARADARRPRAPTERLRDRVRGDGRQARVAASDHFRGRKRVSAEPTVRKSDLRGCPTSLDLDPDRGASCASRARRGDAAAGAAHPAATSGNLRATGRTSTTASNPPFSVRRSRSCAASSP